MTPLLFVPGCREDSGPFVADWLQAQLPRACTLELLDPTRPVLAEWAASLRAAVLRQAQPVRLVAQGFGALAGVVVAADRPDRVAELILVAPAHPGRFDFLGAKPASGGAARDLDLVLSQQALRVRGHLLAAGDDTLLSSAQAAALATVWGLQLHTLAPGQGALEAAGLLRRLLAQAAAATPLAPSGGRRGRGSCLAAVRHYTRWQSEKPRSSRHRIQQR
ncbi:MAG TPA: alpha/beta hydrolase [Hyphomicrobiales bacterium]|nr:alpha/beta hydrolase [Hyphomicrobiales bacterium]